jgi:hypothetical protein
VFARGPVDAQRQTDGVDGADLVAAFGSEACTHNGQVEYTPFCLVTGSGHQYFLETTAKLGSRHRKRELGNAPREPLTPFFRIAIASPRSRSTRGASRRILSSHRSGPARVGRKSEAPSAECMPSIHSEAGAKVAEARAQNFKRSWPCPGKRARLDSCRCSYPPVQRGRVPPLLRGSCLCGAPCALPGKLSPVLKVHDGQADTIVRYCHA